MRNIITATILIATAALTAGACTSPPTDPTGTVTPAQGTPWPTCTDDSGTYLQGGTGYTTCMFEVAPTSGQPGQVRSGALHGS